MTTTSDRTNPTFRDENETNSIRAVPDGQYAITVRHARIQYKDVVRALVSGAMPTINVVLKDFNMNVKKGHIYGLLGASGCGKTSVLRAIVGQLDLAEGEIRVLGHKPKTPKSGIPGTTIGYMPQDLCLLEEFTIKESLYFYGKLGGMSSDEIDAKCDYFVKLLDLPKSNRIVGTLSGGQKRRVSFATALMHSPPILILDEPTVGVDPLLRESIWEYLTKIARSEGATVLITTHYIDEASKSDTVGLMRRGKLMAEQSPTSLMQCLQCNSLEDVLLKLCILHSTKKRSLTSTNGTLDLPMLHTIDESDVSTDVEASIPDSKKTLSLQRLQALAWKDSIHILHHYVSLALIVFLPVFCLILFCLSVGGHIKNLKVSVFNQESNCLTSGLLPTNVYGNSSNCTMIGLLSCRMVQAFQEIGSVTPMFSESRISAENDVRRGQSWAALTFSKNFTSSFMARAAYSSPFDVAEEVIEAGTIEVVMDQSDQIVSNLLKQQMVTAFKRVLSDVNDVCNNLKHAKDLPMQFKPPIYGQDISYLDFALPSGIVSTSMMFPCTTTIATLLPEKIQGTLERGLILGVKMHEVLISMFVVCLVPSLLSSFIAVVTSYQLLGNMMIGSYWTIAGIVIPLTGCGMLLGFVTALINKTVTAALLMATTIWLTFFFAGGSVWPIEGAYPLIQPIFWSLPLSFPAEGIRNVALRGWTFGYKSLRLTMTSLGFWFLAYIVIITLLLRLKR